MKFSVSGLLKNIRDKAAGGPPKERPPLKSCKSTGWDSSEDEAISTDSSDTESSPSLSASPPRQKVSM